MRQCLSTVFFMNASKKIPNTKHEGSYLSLMSGINLRLDSQTNLYEQGNLPNLIIYSEATGA